MHDDIHGADGTGPNPVWIAVGRSLEAIYQGYVHSPLPERLTELLKQLELAVQDERRFDRKRERLVQHE